jgi:predicted GTPase
MRECAIVGKPNSGKTLFALNFAAFLGCKTIDITFKSYDNLIFCKHYSLTEAKHELCGATLHKTRGLQSIILNMLIGKGNVSFKLTDTCGISEPIHNDEAVRRSMAQAIGLMRSADFIIHIIDLAAISEELNDKHNIDREIYNYGLSKKNYVLLANKTDLSCSKEKLNKVSALFDQTHVLPISALYSQNFKEVKACVARNI